MSDALPPAILLGGEMIALSVARGLSTAGIDVYGLGHRDDPLRHSRHRRVFVDVDVGGKQEERFMTWLAEEGPGEGVVLPCCDEGLELVGRDREPLHRLGYLAIEANDDALLAMLDKSRTYELARAAGIEVPWMVDVHSADEARAAAEQVGYPCALKPRHSHLFAHRFGAGRKAFVVGDDAGLEAAVEQTVGAGLEMTVTEIIPGPDASFCSYFGYFDEDGTPLFELTKRKLRQFPTGFGLGSFHVLDEIPEVATLARRFFAHAGVRGLANVEFKRDERDGRLKLIECNHRFTAVNEQLRACGVDLGRFAYNRIVGLAATPPRPRRRDIGFWYPLRDARAFVDYRRRGELTAWEWLRSLMRPLRFPVGSLDDPLPSLFASVRRLRRLLSRLVLARGAARPPPGPSR